MNNNDLSFSSSGFIDPSDPDNTYLVSIIRRGTYSKQTYEYVLLDLKLATVKKQKCFRL